jgi:hypothetical protein
MDTDWIQVGMQVAEYDHGLGRFGDATITRVKKVTTTQIVCATGHVFRRDTGYAFGSGRGLLLPLGDTRVVDAVARAKLAELPPKIDQLCQNAGHRAKDVIAVLDRVSQAVGDARAAIERLGEQRHPS